MLTQVSPLRVVSLKRKDTQVPIIIIMKRVNLVLSRSDDEENYEWAIIVIIGHPHDTSRIAKYAVNYYLFQKVPSSTC